MPDPDANDLSLNPGPAAARPSEGLLGLRARLAKELAYLGLPQRSWVPARERDGQPMLDVAIVGAGVLGLCAAAALRLAGVERLRLYDRAPAGREGPWRTQARMPTLRTAKEAAGPALGLPALTFRAYVEARFGEPTWQAMDLPPTWMWADYLDWYREAMALPVVNDTALVGVAPQADAVAVDLQGPQGRQRLWARHLVLATGIDGLGRPRVPEVLQRLDRRWWKHSSEPLTAEDLRGRRVAVLGAGASAMDNVALAAESGALSVDLLVRRAALPSLDRYTGGGSPGAAHGVVGLPDAWKWRFLHAGMAVPIPPPRPSVLRAARQPQARLHLGSPLLAAEAQEDGLRLRTPKGSWLVDLVIAATGFCVDLGARPELAAIAPHLRTWADRYRPPPGLEQAEMAAMPDLGPAYAFQPKRDGELPGLERVHALVDAAALSHGRLTSGIPPASVAAQRLSRGLVRSLFVEDRATHLAALEQADLQALQGDEWPG